MMTPDTAAHGQARRDLASLPVPPDVPGHPWRPVRPGDLPAIRELQLACAEVYGNPADKLADYSQSMGKLGGPPIGDTICCVDPEGRMIALGWVRTDPEGPLENRTGLFGEVHPRHRRRGLGTYILRWTEARGRQLIAAQPHLPAMLRVDFSDRRDDAIPVYERLGFRLGFHEYWMCRDLNLPVPDHPLPAGMRFVPYARELAPLAVEVYNDAFATSRPPGQPGLTLEDWIAGFERDADFRSELTLLAMAGADGAGLVVGEIGSVAACTRDGAEGWVASLGVRPRWRGRGVGAALLARVMRGYRGEGLSHAALSVNRDNPAALRLYERLGFEITGDRVMYRKDV